VHRIGGDEFAAVLCSSDLEGGERVVQRFRQLLEASTDGEPDDFYVNARIGLAVALRGGEIAELESDALRAKRRDVSGGVDKAMDVEQTAVQLIATADKALYADGAC
jgi:GGDEF domain-containing protein